MCCGQKWEEVSQSQIKKVKKIWVREGYKQDKAEQRLVRSWQNLFCNQQNLFRLNSCFPLQKEDAEKRLKNLEEAKQIVLTLDSSLPTAKRVRYHFIAFLWRQV